MIKFKETKSKKACLGCPFRKVNTCEKPNPGGSHPFVYLGQARGPFWLPCHEDKNYNDASSDVEKVSQCRGAAIFRSNCEAPYELPDQLLKLEKDKETVFSNEKEFLQNYLDITEGQALNLTQPSSLDMMMDQEMHKKSKTRRRYERDS